MSEDRLQKILAKADFGSRRACETLIEEGRVSVNGRVATLGDKADPGKDDIRVDGQAVSLKQFEKRYYVFHKPKNVLSTNKAPHGDDRPTVRELIPVDGHLFTIGRLDAESEGLMVLTNDGDLANKLAHPRYEHTKTYKVTVYGNPSPATIEEWEKGVWLDGKRTAPCYVRILESNAKVTVLRIVMLEGRKRQIRRIASMLGHPVQRLIRTHIGQLGLGTLKKGTWYRLEEEEVAYMSMPAEEVQFLRRKNPRPRQYGGRPDVGQGVTGASGVRKTVAPRKPTKKTGDGNRKSTGKKPVSKKPLTRKP